MTDGPVARQLLLFASIMALATALLTVTTAPSQAHQSGCHRWHSCPSDSGSYVCGDLGYYSGCPGYTPPVGTIPNPTPTVSAPAGSAPAEGSSYQVGQGSGIGFTVDSAAPNPHATIAKGNSVDSNGVLAGGYPVTLAPTSPGSTTYSGALPWSLFSGSYATLTIGTYYWQSYVIDASACATNGCYLVSPVLTFTVLAAAVPPPAPPPPAPTASPEDAATCAADKRRRDRLAGEVSRLRRQLKHTSSRTKRARLKRKLHARRAALTDARDDVAADC